MPDFLPGRDTPPSLSGGFAEQLDWHLANGTRPDTAVSGATRPWGNREFAQAVGPISERSVRNWRRGANLPADLDAVELALFGDHRHYASWKARLREAYDVARAAEVRAVPIVLGSAPIAQTSFPPRPARCVGREGEISSLIDVLCAPQQAHVVVLGAPGMGKTTLTLEAASRPEVVEKFGARKWFVPFEHRDEPEAIDAAMNRLDAAIVRALGMDPGSHTLDDALEKLAVGPSLILLDNLEVPWEANRLAVEARLAKIAAIPTVSLLGSFRGYDSVLGIRWTREINLGPLGPDDATALFCDIARRIPASDPHLPDLMAALGGAPLAITLVAQRASVRDRVLELWEEWQRVGVALARRQGVALSPFTSVERTITVSLQSCRIHEAGRRLFRWLGQLPAGISKADRLALLGDDAFDAESGMLSVGLGIARGDRLDLLPPVRDFAARYEAPEGNDAKLWARHYLALVRDDGTRIGFCESATLVSRLRPEFPNIEAAANAAISAGDRTAAMEALDGIYRVMAATGDGSSAIFQRLADACRRDGDTRGEAGALRRLGNISKWRSDISKAHDAFKGALEIYTDVDDLPGVAACIKGLGDTALATGRLFEAIGAFDRAMSHYREIGSSHGEADCLVGLGEVALAQKNYVVAQREFEKAQVIYRQQDGFLGHANATKGLADVEVAQGNFPVSRKIYHEALRQFRAVGNELGAGNVLRCLASIASGADRDRLLEGARSAWASINRSDLAEALDTLTEAPATFGSQPTDLPELAYT